MEARSVEVKEKIPASRKLQADDARELLSNGGSLVVAKGKKVTRFSKADLNSAEAVEAMLGPTGNLRAPTMRLGKKLVVGFNEEVFGELFA